MNTTINEGIIYTRVSSDKQVREGNGLDSQLFYCKKLAKDKSIKVIGIFEDPGVSGKLVYRPGLEKMKRFLKNRNRSTWLIIDDLDRFSRLEAYDYFHLKRELIELGAKFISVNDDLVTESPETELMENQKIIYSAYQRKKNQERVNSKMRARLRSGYWVFHPPAGYLLEHKILLPDPHNTPLIQKIFNDFSSDIYPSIQSLKESSAFKGLLNPKTNKPYLQRPETLRNILTNKMYIGKIEFLKWDIKDIEGHHDAIVSSEIFEETQEKLRGNKKKKHRHISLDEFPLKGDLVCGKCKSTLVASYTTGRSSKKYPYYRCKSNSSNCQTSPKSLSREVVHDQILNLLGKATIRKEVLLLADKVLEDTFHEKSKHLIGIQKSNSERITELKRQKVQQIKKILSFSNEHVLKSLDDEITSIDNEIRLLRKEVDRDTSLDDFRLATNVFFRSPKDYWLKGSAIEKKVLFDFVFDKPIEIRDGKVGTAHYSLPYRLLSQPVIQKEGMVELGGIEPPTSCVPRRRSPS